MKKIKTIILLTLIVASASAQFNPLSDSITLQALYDVPVYTDYGSVIYIDPDYSGTESGTISEPYNSWLDVTFVGNTAYLQKAGTFFEFASDLATSSENILIGSYGVGDKPIINFAETATKNKWNFTGDSVVVRDLYFHNYLEFGEYGGGGDASTRGNILFNCYINRRVYGVTPLEYGSAAMVSWGGYMKVIGNTMFNCGNDGIFVESNLGSDSLYIAYNNIYNINIRWVEGGDESAHPGDGIQIEGVETVHIHHNIIDKSIAAHKFCIIVQDKDANLPNGLKIVIEDNLIISPFKDNDGASGIYIQGETTYGYWATIRRNVIHASFNGSVYSDNAIVLRDHFIGKAEIYSNVMVGFDGNTLDGATSVDTLHYYHNTSFDVNGEVDNGGHVDYGVNNLNVVLADSNDYFTSVYLDSFNLVEGSVAIDAGVATILTHDFNGVAIPQGESPDLGAYEYGEIPVEDSDSATFKIRMPTIIYYENGSFKIKGVKYL